ncbi:endonuclease [Dokdonia sp. Hel_I_53]|uniref:endonuclease/exonuclease/phosphatase family protein n=1 Tax=Dokdonia sp. Hel_I_53 TaxID=1566287 RepID=UPI00119AD07B|nr:endonuclease [Dokdonia sp. Hel_I_53]TVZ52393.1 Endonuclease/Exonuclease/phosphatase family protein [Dokdonia sp. Hel_I_53]
MEDNSAFAKAQQKQNTCIAFYNLENLFDTTNNPHNLDDDFTPEGIRNWNTYKYEKKLEKLSSVISKIGRIETNTAPSILGVAEVENKSVLEDLIATDRLKEENFGIVHYDSPDERGIDVALLYKKNDFIVIESKPITLMLEAKEGGRDYTRDILYVKGNLHDSTVHILVNHWPSRRQGANDTAHKRITAAARNREIIDNILAANPDARIIVMGDFNDGPHSESIKTHLAKTDLYNPMLYLGTKYAGSLNHKFEWFIFDQILMTNNFVKMHKNPLLYDKSDIFNDFFITEFEGRFKGNPFRTYAGDRYLGGYSDHFPVYSIFTATLNS